MYSIIISDRVSCRVVLIHSSQEKIDRSCNGQVLVTVIPPPVTVRMRI